MKDTKKIAYIYKEEGIATQSGLKERWILTFQEGSKQYIEPIMGWTGNKDTSSQIRQEFACKDSAIEYALQAEMEFEIIDIMKKESKIKPKNYTKNFS